MPLKIILEKMRELLEAEIPACSEGRQTLFFSVTDGYSPASVFSVYGEGFAQAWERGLLTLQSLPVDLLAQNAALRIDVVERVESLRWGTMRQILSQTPHHQLSFGIAFDPDLTQAFLEPEIAANALLYVDGLSIATPNDANLMRYSQARFSTPLCWPDNDEQPIWRFTTRAAYTDGVTSSIIAKNKNEAPQDNSLLTMINSAADYLSRQIGENGEYQYYGTVSADGPTAPLFLQPIATCALLDAWEITNNKKQMAAIERSLTFLNDNLLRSRTLSDGETIALFTENNGEIFCVGNAFMILAMAKYTALSGNRRFVAQMRKLAGGLIWMQSSDEGRFSCMPHTAGLAVQACRQRAVFHGVAPLALLRLYALTLEPRWLDAAERAIRHLAQYINGSELASAVDELTRWRPLPEYYRLELRGTGEGQNDTADLRQATAMFRMMSRLAEFGDNEGAGAFGEMDIHRIIETRAACGRSSYLSPDVAMFFTNPHGITGGFCRLDRGCRVRIDDVAWLLSGYVHYAHYVKQRAREREERGKQLVFLCGDLRHIGNGIEVSSVRRAKLFTERLHVTPRMITAAWNVGVKNNAALYREKGELPGDVRVENIHDWLHTLLERGIIRPLGISESRGPSGPGRLSRVQGDVVNQRRIDDFINSLGQILLRRIWAVHGQELRLMAIEINDSRKGVVSFNRESAFVAWVLEAGLSREGEWHFLVDKNLPWRDFLLSRPQTRFKATVTALFHITHIRGDGRQKINYAHILAQPEIVDRLIVLTKEQSEDLLAEGFPAAKLCTIPHHRILQVVKEKSVKKTGKRVLIMARYAPEKQHALLLRAFARVLKQVPDAELHTYGSGIYRQELEKQVIEMGLEKSIFINGVTAEITRCQQESCCAVLSSREEGFPLFGLESLEHGTPLVSFAIRYGPKDLLSGFDAGRLVPPGDESALASALVEILTHPDPDHLRREALKSAARFSIDSVAPLWASWWADMQSLLRTSSER